MQQNSSLVFARSGQNYLNLVLIAVVRESDW